MSRRKRKMPVEAPVTVRWIDPEPKRKPPRTTSWAPLTDKQRLLLLDLRQQLHLPRHGISKLTRAEAASEIDELFVQRKIARTTK